MPPDPYLTVGEVAAELGQPLHRVLYIIDSRRIEPAARIGRIRAFTHEQVEVIKRELAGIDLRVGLREGGEEVSGE